MADVKISALPASTTPLAGTEVLPVVQGTTTKQVSVTNLTSGRFVNASSVSVGNTTDPGAGNLNVAGSVSANYAGTSVIAMSSLGSSYTGYLYSVQNQPLAFGTAGAERMRINANGDVGIGTQSPKNFGLSYKTLELKGASPLNGGIFTTSTSDSTVEGILFTDSSSGLVLQSTTSHALVFRTNNVEQMRIFTSGGISIGNTVDKGAGSLNVSGLIYPQQATTAAAPAYVKGAIYFDTTLNKLRVGGATAWETITSV